MKFGDNWGPTCWIFFHSLAEKVNDKEAEGLSFEIARKIQNEMTYPGQIKITVIRETRAVNFAK